ncbi:D-alanyl-D-alanine carboxypeptidase [Streptomyces sp. NPDC002523]
MEEASVAGESPDRSKQRESSVEPTPETRDSVPEARDPRLAVSREKDSAAAAVDTATKVLSVRDLKSEEDDTESPKGDDDTDLKNAVSAWVRSASTPKAEQEPKAGQEQEPTAGTAPTAGTEAEAAAAPEAGTGAKADAEVRADTESDANSDDTPSEPAAEDAKTATDPTADEEATSEPATEAAAEDTAEAADEPEAEPADESPTASDDDRQTPDEDPQTTDKASEAPEASDEDSQAADEAPRAADGEDAPQRPPAADDETRTGGADGNTDTDTDTEATDTDADPRAADGEKAPQGPPAADGATRTGGADGNTDTEGEAEATDTDADREAKASPVDQPTTAFKALRPKKPEVDQPTTMLKLGGSKFVPLRNPDVPSTTATTAFPQVGPERTTQQPLPPKPPLDLLAELTNTPPPPQTPFRTLIRRVKIWTPLVLLLAIVFAVVQTLRPLPKPTLDLTTEETYTFGGAKPGIPWPATGQAALDVQGIGTFGSSGTQKPVPIASLAKVMTAYLVLRDHPLKSGADGPKIKIDKPAEEQSDAGQESTVPVTAGDRISEREALEAILLPSANNVARLLARWDSGSEEAFVTKMNAAAKDLGMTDTRYTDPSGLTDSTVSTAVDQVKLAKAAMEQPAFREVAAMMSYDDYKGVNHSNYNRLVGHNNVVGIKTGTTTSALGNLVFAAKQDVGGETRTIIGAVMRQPAGGFDNTIISGVLDAGDKLIRAAQGALKPATVLKKGDVVGYVDDGLGGRTPVVVTKDVTAAGWSGLKVKLSFTSASVPHIAKAGTEVGTLTVGDGSAGSVKVPVALRKDLAKPGFTAKLTRLG